MLNLLELVEQPKIQEVPSTSPNRFILVEEIYQDISKQMLETNYTLNLG
jgi:UTP-glucose-1-phosphate uridylyltransferase